MEGISNPATETTPSHTREPVRLEKLPVARSRKVVRALIIVVMTMAYAVGSTIAPNERHTMIPVMAVGAASSKAKNDNE